VGLRNGDEKKEPEGLSPGDRHNKIGVSVLRMRPVFKNLRIGYIASVIAL